MICIHKAIPVHGARWGVNWGVAKYADASGCGEGECRSRMGEVTFDFNILHSAVQTSSMSAKEEVSRDLESVSVHEACTLAHKRVNTRRR